ncbi:MAG TPA: NADPH-dependent FMN reductase [Stellaceae bacterium]|jgi:chromate reductase|nr:NADPH-dependent FMN reductase [Stellaceae bacterium]
MSEAKGITVLGICGSLRKGSYNMAALRTAVELKPPGMTIEIADISQFPLYNEDVRAQGFPPAVETFRRQIKGADALLFACPEYNYSMSGVLKNAIDWASRPPDQPFAGKPAAIMGAGAGMAGTARAQGDLRRSCVFLDIHPLNKPEVLIGQVQSKFDADGRLTDEAARGFIRDLLTALERRTRRMAQRDHADQQEALG